MESDLLNIWNSSNESHSEVVHDDYEKPLYLESHFPLMVFTALIIGGAGIIGTIGNILIIAAVSAVKQLRTCGNLLVANLAIADMIITCFVDPFNVVGAVAGRKVLMHNHALCDWIASFCAPACVGSMWNMCAISINRYILICHPQMYPKIYTVRSTLACCVVVWIMACMLHLPNHIGWGKIEFSTNYYLCTLDMELHSYVLFFIFLGILLPMAGVLFGYWKIFNKVRSTKYQMRTRQRAALEAMSKTGASDHTADPVANHEERLPSTTKRLNGPGFSRDDVKLAKTLFAAFVIFLICWLPHTILVTANNPKFFPPWVYVLAVTMAHGNSAVNPILYGWNNEKFRQGYRKVLGLKGRTVGHSSASFWKQRTEGARSGFTTVEKFGTTSVQ